MMGEENKIRPFMYKGKPLVRQGQFIFYGNPDDKAILFMNILETKKSGDLDVASRVLVQIQKTGESVSFNEKVIKQCEKKSFYDAFEIGLIWLERELKK
ncbi:MAG: hypothetical protein ACOX3X_00470 [Eubacteriales bacterium]|jgi:hypothetical protein